MDLPYPIKRRFVRGSKGKERPGQAKSAEQQTELTHTVLAVMASIASHPSQTVSAAPTNGEENLLVESTDIVRLKYDVLSRSRK
jgi:hypothetical protein